GLSLFFFFFSSRRRHTRSKRDWSSDVCSSDLYDLSLVFFKRATRANPPFAEVAEVRFFCFFFLVKKRKVLKVLCILVISMQGFVGRANSLAEHTLYHVK